jgi:small subunit ribosomal protein S8
MDPIADMLTRIRNGQNASLATVVMPHSKMKESIAQILKKEGYISEHESAGEKQTRTLSVKLKYAGRTGVIQGLKRISRPGIRTNVKGTDIPRVRGGLGVAILSTSHGVMTGRDARKQNFGGEVLCYIW